VKITQVHYQKLVNLGDYQNERIGAWATIEEGESPAAALTALTDWVEERGNARAVQEDEISAARTTIARLRDSAHTLAREVEEMRQTWRKGRAFLATVGLELPRSYFRDGDDSDMPF